MNSNNMILNDLLDEVMSDETISKVTSLETVVALDKLYCEWMHDLCIFIYKTLNHMIAEPENMYAMDESIGYDGLYFTNQDIVTCAQGLMYWSTEMRKHFIEHPFKDPFEFHTKKEPSRHGCDIDTFIVPESLKTYSKTWNRIKYDWLCNVKNEEDIYSYCDDSELDLL